MTYNTKFIEKVCSALSLDHPRILSFLDNHGNRRCHSGIAVLEAARAAQEQLKAALGPGPHTILSVVRFGEDLVFPLLGTLMAGWTFVSAPVTRRNDRSGRFIHMVGLCHPAVILCQQSQVPLLEAELGPGRQIALWPIDDPAAQPDRPIPSQSGVVGPDRPIIQFTSGTSRMPKAIALAEEPLLNNMSMMYDAVTMKSNTVSLNWTPLYHDMGLIFGLLTPLVYGIESIQMDAFDMIRNPASWLRAISDYRVTLAGAPAFAFRECVDRIRLDELEGVDLSCWATVYAGAEPVPRTVFPDFHQKFSAAGLRKDAFINGYGMAECTVYAAGSTSCRVNLPPEDPAAAALPFEPIALAPGDEMRLRITDPETGAALPEGTEGEVWITGDFVQQGYLRDPETTKNVFGVPADGRLWLRSGDLGLISANRLYITGRLKDVVIVGGRNHAAAEIEWLACSADPRLKPFAAAAFLLDDGAMDQVALWIETHDEPSDDDAQVVEGIRRRVRSGIGLNLAEVRLLPRGSLPRTTSGKIQRQRMREFRKEVLQ